MPLTLYPQNTEGAVRAPEPVAGRGAGSSTPVPGVELPADLREELLDPAAWRAGLEKYALAMHLAVALVDTDGRLLGPCLNPRPLWSLLRTPESAEAGGCPFAVAPSKPCPCVADALRKWAV